jgi:hypothetical protein
LFSKIDFEVFLSFVSDETLSSMALGLISWGDVIMARKKSILKNSYFLRKTLAFVNGTLYNGRTKVLYSRMVFYADDKG